MKKLKPDHKGKAVYLSAPVNALVQGYYEQNTTIAEIKEHGDFGLGTFNDLDGEMVILDNIVYQVKDDGMAYPVGDDKETPFACLTFFTPDTVEEINGERLDVPLEELLNLLIPSANMLYAIRIDGEFKYIKTRSVPRQENYRPLVEVAREQPTFEYHEIKGTLGGFYTPQFMASLNVPGYHLHFMNEDRTRGGHMLECEFKEITVGLQHVPRLEVGLPLTIDYLTADLTEDTRRDLEEAEH
ncbi:MAG: acetolactate decarboxylase [Candidatus Euphemobacter frigidus]|nr:acetolactate decarboxylase [Candidatus Euphemobacter frigidus]MDP8275624.1 acetolactate decarboxylase [Candidatus Euphemobacter frigidus]